jgi:hypothetical protein
LASRRLQRGRLGSGHSLTCSRKRPALDVERWTFSALVSVCERCGSREGSRFTKGWVAQLAEQWTENPRVAGSIPAPAKF